MMVSAPPKPGAHNDSDNNDDEGDGNDSETDEEARVRLADEDMAQMRFVLLSKRRHDLIEKKRSVLLGDQYFK